MIQNKNVFELLKNEKALKAVGLSYSYIFFAYQRDHYPESPPNINRKSQDKLLNADMCSNPSVAVTISAPCII